MSATVTEQPTPQDIAPPVPTPYRGPHRRNLEDNSDIEALEQQRRAAMTAAPGQPEPTVEEVQEDPSLVEPARNSEDATWKKRYADLRRHLAQRDQEWQAKFAEVQGQLQEAAQKTLQLPTSEDEIKKWSEQYPEVAKIVEAIAMRQADNRAKAIEAKLQVAEKKAKEAERETAETKLRERHPDLDKLKEAAEFHDWAKGQSPMIQAALYRSPNWQDCAAAIDLFKAQTGWGKQEEPPKKGPGRPRKEDAAAAAVNVPSARVTPSPDQHNGKKVWRESEVQHLNKYAWEANEADIIAARREGRFVYDLSGGTR